MPYSTSLRLSEPTPGDPAVKNAWGTIVNTNMTLLEAAVLGTANVNIGGLTSYTLSTANGAADEARPLIQNYTGALAGTCTVTVPNVPKVGYARNATTGSHSVVLTSGAGTTATIPPNSAWYFWYSDGATNVALFLVGFGGLAGTTTNDNAAAGLVGEYVSSTVLVGAAVAMSNGASGNITSISLAAGDWNVWGSVALASGATGITGLSGGINTSSATLPSVPPYALFSIGAAFGTGSMVFPTGSVRMSLPSITTVYLIGNIAFSGGTAAMYGSIEGRRPR